MQKSESKNSGTSAPVESCSTAQHSDLTRKGSPPPTLDILVTAWQGADEQLRWAALAILRRQQPLVPATLGRTYSITETGRLAGISRQTVHAALRAGALRASPLYPGGRRRVREADLRVWLAGRAA